MENTFIGTFGFYTSIFVCIDLFMQVIYKIIPRKRCIKVLHSISMFHITNIILLFILIFQRYYGNIEEYNITVAFAIGNMIVSITFMIRAIRRFIESVKMAR